MPIVDVQVVLEAGQQCPAGSAASIADAIAAVLHAPPQSVWLRLAPLACDRYAENAATESVLPVFVTILHADLPPPEVLAAQAVSLARAIGACLDRGAELVHVEYAPAGRGRIAFGGKLLE